MQSIGYSALLAKKMGIVSSVMIPCIPSGLSSEMAMAAERKRNPREKTATKSEDPKDGKKCFYCGITEKELRRR